MHSAGVCHLLGDGYRGFCLNFLKITFLATVFGWVFVLPLTACGKDFLLVDTYNRPHKLSDYRGKWVVVNYWATWCPPCLEEMPSLVALYDARKAQDVMVIGVAIGYETPQEVLSFADDMLVSYPIVLGDESATRQIGQADVLPTTFVFNPRGELVKVKRGLVTKQYLEDLFATMAKQGAKSTR